MRVLLISANTERINMPAPPLGLGLVAAAARRAGHDVAFLDLLGEAEPDTTVRQAIETHAPEAIGLSVRNIDDQDMQTHRFLLEPVKRLVQTCRDSTDAPVILGGAGYSMFPDAALTYLNADLGVCGEGEVAFPALLDRLQQEQDPSGLPGVHSIGGGCQASRQFAPDLDSLPLADNATWLSMEPNTPDLCVPVQTRRGCPLDCSYCSTADIEGWAVRARSPRLVVEHIRQVADAGFKRFFFVDNTFNFPSSYAVDLCNRITQQRLDIVWHCILYPQGVTEDLVVAMAESGCKEVSLGFESGSKGVLRAMNKRFEPEEVRRISELLVKHGIRRMGFLLLGGPGETRETVGESLAFADSLDLQRLKVTVGIRIYPRTPLAKIAVQEGMISAEDDLLFPQYYLRPELADWILDVVPPPAS